MRADFVADVGNSRIKWGRCLGNRVCETVSLPIDTEDWEKQYRAWRSTGAARWVVSSVNPGKLAVLLEWIKAHGDFARVLDSAKQLPLQIDLEAPDRVGIDRLLNAVAARHRCPGNAAIIVDVGSAVTVDLVNASGAFAGGAIFPGVRLMAKALNEHTALLPLVSLDGEIPSVPGKSTVAAMKAGIFAAVTGGVQSLIEKLRPTEECQVTVFVTGGDAHLVAPALPMQTTMWPEMTLEGIRLSAENLPDE
jgi:type III pantothenate kinase